MATLLEVMSIADWLALVGDDADGYPGIPGWGAKSASALLAAYGTIEKIHYALYVRCREAIGREASPTACVIDSQSVKSAEKGGPASIHPGMMRARRSRGSSGISWSTR